MAEPAGLGRQMVRSTLWMVGNSLFVRGASFVAQLALASLLTTGDFGVYAASIALTALLTVLRGGGIYEWQIQRGAKDLQRNSGDVYWASMAMNTLLGALMCALAVPAASFFGQPGMTSLILVIGLTFPLISPGAYHRNLLAAQLRMRELSIVEVASAAVRYPLMVVLALVGMGPLSFVLPLPVSYIVEWVVGAAFTRDRGARRPCRPSTWPALFWSSRWIATAGVIFTIAANIDYLTVGHFAPISTLGAYFFAYQMTYMSATLVTDNARRVLFPGLVTVEEEDRPAAAARATEVATLLGTPLLLALGAVAGPLQALLWHGKWEDAVVPIVVFSLGLPLHFLAMLTQAGLASRGRFRLWASFSAFRAVCVGGGALIGCLWFADSAATITVPIAVGMAVADLSQTLLSYRGTKVSLTRLLWGSRAALSVGPMALVAAVAAVRAVAAPPILGVLLAVATLTVVWCAGTALLSRRQAADAMASARSALRRSATTG